MTVIAAGKKQITADELLAMGDIGRCELIDGEIIHMAPAGAQHGGIAGQVYGFIWTFVMPRKLGRVFTAETGFTIKRNPDTVRAPDIAFVKSNRLPNEEYAGFFDGAPDLAVEVCSPSDRWSEVLAKIDQWLAVGCTSVWVVDPPSKSIEIYRRDSQSVRYHVGQKITDEPTLPGFELSVEDIFK
jgi:Uma2 family endonuclease